MSHVLAIDQGTSSSRALVVAADGSIVAVASREFDQQFPHEGWVEQDPEIIWQTTIEAAREAIDKAPGGIDEIASIGIANQRETTLVWDAQTGEAVHPAIVWQDRRTAQRCQQIESDGFAPTISSITGLVVDPYFSSTKLEWLLQRDDVKRLAQTGRLRFGTVDAFLVWRLTGGSTHATDATNAARTQLYDIAEHRWSEVLVDYFGIPQSVLPAVKDCVDDFGVTDPKWLGKALPITGIAGDQQAALIGQGCFTPGSTKSTFGTGCFVIVNTGGQRVASQSNLLTTVGYRYAGETTFALEGSIFSAGVAIKWLRDTLGIIDDAAQTQTCAERIAGDTKGVYVVPAFTGLGAPHWEPDARATITGLTLDSGRDEIVTATLQSVAYQTHDLLMAVRADGVSVDHIRIDGGMVQNDWFCQFLADVLNTAVERPAVVETTALGAAMLAATGAGIVGDLATTATAWALDRRFDPVLQADARQRLLEGWNRAVRQTLNG